MYKVDASEAGPYILNYDEDAECLYTNTADKAPRDRNLPPKRAAFIMAGTIPEKWGIYGIFCCCHGLSDSHRCTGLGVWGVANLLEGYGSDSPGAKMLEVHRDIKQEKGK